MKKIYTLLLTIVSFSTSAQFSNSNWWDKDILLTKNQYVLVNPKIIIQDKWDTLPQAQFWKKILTLSKDRVNIFFQN
jgi:hypothetical protein